MAKAYPLLEEIKLKTMVVSDEGLVMMDLLLLPLIAEICENWICQRVRGRILVGHWLSHFLDACTLESLNMACLSSEVSLSALQRLVARSTNLKTRAVQLDKLTFLNLSYATIESPDVSKIISQCPNLERLWGKFAFESPNSKKKIKRRIRRDISHKWKSWKCELKKSSYDPSLSMDEIIAS
nr:hypothetical protein [Tanacetum cinerariifolium]